MSFVTRTWMVVLCLVASLATGCAVSEKEELSMGQKFHPQFEKESGGRYADPVVQSYVNSVGMEMARRAGRPEMKWQFHVLSSPQINAFAVPGGYIYITQGLLFRMQNEAQLAGVLGHEAGHIAYRHSAKSIETQRYTAIGTAGVSILASAAGYGGVGDAASTVAQLGLLRYSRAHETEADMAGLKYMTDAGYNPQGIVQLMQVLKSAAGSGGTGPLGDWTSSHPDPGNRIEYLTKAIRDNPRYAALAQTGRWGAPEFQTNVLSRRPGKALAPVGPHDFLWCQSCRLEATAGKAARTEVAMEMLRDDTLATRN